MSLAGLDDHAERLAGASMADLLAEPGRDAALQFDAPYLSLDARRQRLDLAAWSALLAAGRESGAGAFLAAIARGDIVNPTEDRPALHMACRNPDRLSDPALAARLREAQARTRAFSEALDDPQFLGGSPVRRIISLGIGGSDLGPRMVHDALKAFRRPGVETRFVSNLDPADLDDALEGADPATTLVLVVSKSFTTQETLMNARAARDWLQAGLDAADVALRFAAATAAPDRAEAFGVRPVRIFPFEDGVGGRYSLWSPAGVSLEIGLAPGIYERLQAGARAMDDHALSAPIEANAAIAKGLVDAWNRTARGRPARCVAAYSSRLDRLPAYLQQLEMESLGKSAARDGGALAPAHSGALVWGGRGSDLQHSVFQWLHQGQDEVPVDFIALADRAFTADARARALNANLAAQGAALTSGRAVTEGGAGPRDMAGGRASATLILDALTPESLGALVALHEHKVAVEAALYGLNPFDQFGVELGKDLARAILSGDDASLDPPARELAVRLGVQRD